MNNKFRNILLTLLLFIVVVIAGGVFADNTTTEGKITVNKIATKDIGVEGNETYGRISNVTLSVTGNGFTTSSPLDVVLVIDRSSSMNDKASYIDTQTKMQATKSSAITLATNLLANNTAGRTVVRMGIVTFGSNVINTVGYGYNAKRLTSTSLSSDATTITNMIRNIPDSIDGQGTNIQSGLEKVKDLLTGSTASNKVVILLTDGKPTYFNYDGTRYGDGSHDGNGYRETPYCVEEDNHGNCTKELKPSTAAIEEADAIKASDGVVGNGIIYTIGFGLGSDTTTTEFLQDVATSNDKAFLANDEDELLANFNNIVQAMTILANNVVVTDTVPAGFVVDEKALKNTYGDKVSLVSNSDGTTTITWDIGTLTVTNDPTLTYQVTAKDDYYGAMYTNKSAVLTGDAVTGNPAYPTGKIKEVFPLPVVAIPSVTKNDSYSIKLGSTLNVNANNGILKNDSSTKVVNGLGNVVSDEIIIKSASCGSVEDIIVNKDGSFSYTPDSSCYVNNKSVVFEYEIKSTVAIDGQNHLVISNTSTITIDLTKDDSIVDNPIVTKTNNGGETTVVIDGPFDYTINYKATIKNHVGSSVITIVDTLPYELDLTKVNVEEDLDGGLYDAATKTITWVENIENIDSYKNQNNSINIKKNITVYYKNVPNDIDGIINTVNVSTNIDNKTVEDTEKIEVIRGNLLVEYVDNKGNNLLDNITSSGLIGSAYNTSAKDVISINNVEYQLVATKLNNVEIEKTNSYSGKYTESDTEVTYVYYMITGAIDEEQTIFTKEGPEIVTTSDGVFNYTITYSSKIDNYIGDATVTIVDTLPYELDLTKVNVEEDLDGGLYDVTTKTITWVQNIKNIDTYNNGTYTVNVEKNIKVVFKNLDANKRELVNEVTAKLETVKSSADEKTDEKTELAIKGNVIAHYVDINGKTIAVDVKDSDLVGNEYTTIAKDIAGYKLVETRGKPVGKYIDGTIEVTYVYYKVEGNILDDSISKSGTNEVTETDAEFEYSVKYNAIIKNYIGNATVTIVDTLPYELDLTKVNVEEDLDGGVYDASTKTITWVEVIENIDTNVNGNKEIEIVKNIKVVYKGLEATTRKVTNSVVGTIVTEVSKEKTEIAIKDTTVKVSGNVIAHYVDIEGNKVAEDESTNGLVGDTYTTSAKNITGYKLVETKGNSTGKYIDGTIDVTYVYYKIVGNIEDNTIIKTGTEEVTSTDAEFEYNVTYKTTIKDYIGNATVTIVDTLPYELDLTKVNVDEDLDGGVYDASTKTITWVENIENIDTNVNGNKEIEIVKNIKVVYKGLEATTRKVINSVVGTLVTEVTKETTKPSEQETLVKVSGKVIAHYVDIEGSKVAEDENSSGLVGDTYTTSAKDVVGYELVETKGNPTGNYTVETIEVTYVYYKETGEIVGDTIEKSGTDEVTETDAEFEYSVKYNAIIKNYIGNATVTIVDTLPYELDLTKVNVDEDLDGGLYDASTKTITWVEVIENIDTNVNGNKEIEIVKNIKVVYKGLEATTRKVTNSAIGTIVTEVSKETTEIAIKDTSVKVMGKVIAHYVDTEGSKVAKDESTSGLVGNEYVTSAKDVAGYELVETKGDLTGNYTVETIEVTYVYYKEIGEIIEDTVEKIGSEEITSREDKVNYTINYKTSIDKYIGNATVTIVDYLPYKLDLAASDLAGGSYDEDNATITWVITITDIDTYNNGVYEIDITKELLLTYKDLDLTVDTITNNVVVIVKTDVSEETTDDSFETEVNVDGKVIVNYVDEFGNILSDTIILSGKVGSSYETSALDIDGYVLVTVDGEVLGEYMEEEQVVTYIYKEIGKGGDVEELPPQTGVNNNGLLFEIISTLVISLFLFVKRFI